MATATISQSGMLRAAAGTDLIEVESAGGVSAHVAASTIGATMPVNTLTPAQLTNMAAAGLLGATAAGAVAQLTVAQATALLNAFTSVLKGLVPASGNDVANFLKANGTWAPPSGTYAPLQQIVTAGSQTTVDFTSIPSGYQALKIIWSGQDTTAGTGNNTMRMTFNNDTTAGNYTATARSGCDNNSGFNNNNSPTTKGCQVGFLANAGNTSSGSGEITIPYYTNNLHKNFFMVAATIYNGLTLMMTANGGWKSTSPITQATLRTDGAAFVNGGVFTLWGITY